MGYKLAGYDVLGCLEIDKPIFDVYVKNHNPHLAFNEDIRDFVKRDDLPKSLYELDIFDGSPPCSTFSMAGNREKDWNKEKKFREGQVKQRLDDLFFEFIRLAEKLQPKVVIAENVKGMITGKAKGYCKEIARAFKAAGYDVQLFLLNAASMGVPQKRERVFFICRRQDLGWKDVRMRFSEPAILLRNAFDFDYEVDGPNKWIRQTEHQHKMWKKCSQGECFAKYNNGNGFNDFRLDSKSPSNTLSAQQHKYHHPTEPRHLCKTEFQVIGTFPLDYDFMDVKYGYLIGMSVPPVMIAQIATELYEQWFSKELITQ